MTMTEEESILNESLQRKGWKPIPVSYPPSKYWEARGVSPDGEFDISYRRHKDTREKEYRLTHNKGHGKDWGTYEPVGQRSMPPSTDEAYDLWERRKR